MRRRMKFRGGWRVLWVAQLGDGGCEKGGAGSRMPAWSVCRAGQIPVQEDCRTSGVEELVNGSSARC